MKAPGTEGKPEALSAEEKRSRIRNVLSMLPALANPKQEVRDRISAIWEGGIYGGSLTVDPDAIDAAAECLRDLAIDEGNEGRRKEILELLESLRHGKKQ